MRMLQLAGVGMFLSPGLLESSVVSGADVIAGLVECLPGMRGDPGFDSQHHTDQL